MWTEGQMKLFSRSGQNNNGAVAGSQIGRSGLRGLTLWFLVAIASSGWMAEPAEAIPVERDWLGASGVFAAELTDLDSRRYGDSYRRESYRSRNEFEQVVRSGSENEFYPAFGPAWQPEVTDWTRLDRDSRFGMGHGVALNRVDGFSILVTEEIRNRGFAPSLQLYQGYGFQSERWSGAIESRIHPFHRSISLGARWGDETIAWPLPYQPITSSENFAAAILSRDDFSDYLRRDGHAFFAEWTPIPGQGLQVAYMKENHESVERGVAQWGIFGGEKNFQSNPSVDEGEWRIIRARGFWSDWSEGLHWGSRSGRAFLADAQWSGGELGGARRFVRLWAEHRGQFALTPSQSLGYRVTAGGTPQGSVIDAEKSDPLDPDSGSLLPRQFQFQAGGVGSLRGHRFQEFQGDRILLGTLEYSVDLGSTPVPVLFVDGGKAWNESQDVSGGVAGSGPLELDGGIGFLLGADGLRIDIARDLRKEHAPARVTVRMARSY